MLASMKGGDRGLPLGSLEKDAKLTTHMGTVWESLVDCPMDQCAGENRCFSGWTTDFAARCLIPGFSEHRTKYHRVWPSKTKTAQKKTQFDHKIGSRAQRQEEPPVAGSDMGAGGAGEGGDFLSHLDWSF